MGRLGKSLKEKKIDIENEISYVRNAILFHDKSIIEGLNEVGPEIYITLYEQILSFLEEDLKYTNFYIQEYDKQKGEIR